MESCIVKDKFYNLNELVNEINRNELGIAFTEMYDYFKNAQITVTEDEINKFLFSKAKEDNVDMSERLRKSGLLKVSEINAEESANEFMKDLIKAKYMYNGYDLTYFKRYVEIIREKSLKFCLIVVSILGGKSLDEMKKVLPDLENAIIMQNGQIDGDSIQRLSRVIIGNYRTMKEKVDKANNLSTYLTTTVNLHRLYADGFNESDLYPPRELQTFNTLMESWSESSLRLSPRQYEIVQSKEMENLKAFLDMDLFGDHRRNNSPQKVLTSEQKD